MWRKLLYVAVAALIPVCFFFVAKNRQPEPIHVDYSELLPAAKKEFATLVSQAAGRMPTVWFTDLCAEFKIADPIEAELWGVPMMDAEERFFAFCFVKPFPKVTTMERFSKIFNAVHLKYARLAAPVSRPVGIFITGKAGKSEFVYDLKTKEWKGGTRVVDTESAVVRTTVVEALRFLQPDRPKPQTKQAQRLDES